LISTILKQVPVRTYDIKYRRLIVISVIKLEEIPEIKNNVSIWQKRIDARATYLKYSKELARPVAENS
jgi:hypothetical protein